jgi:hypothetical protein
MNTITIAITEPIRKTESMEVLWGAWIKQARFHRKQRAIDIVGIYDEIWKEGKSDFPFITDLQVILAFRVVDIVEVGQTYEITFDLRDKYGIEQLLSNIQKIIVPDGDFPLWWYDTFPLSNVLIREPGLYGLSISIERQFKQHIPLWVLAPKVMMIDNGAEMWIEDWLEQRGKKEE